MTLVAGRGALMAGWNVCCGLKLDLLWRETWLIEFTVEELPEWRSVERGLRGGTFDYISLASRRLSWVSRRHDDIYHGPLSHWRKIFFCQSKGNIRYEFVFIHMSIGRRSHKQWLCVHSYEKTSNIDMTSKDIMKDTLSKQQHNGATAQCCRAHESRVFFSFFPPNFPFIL